jgi:hypothetical protein
MYIFADTYAYVCSSLMQELMMFKQKVAAGTHTTVCIHICVFVFIYTYICICIYLYVYMYK